MEASLYGMRPSSCGLYKRLVTYTSIAGALADHLVAISPISRRYQDLPRAQRAGIQRIFHAERGRFRAQIHQRHLEHALRRDPQIGLMQMEVEGLDGAGIAQRRGDLRGLGEERRRRVPWPMRITSRKYPRSSGQMSKPRMQANSVDEALRIRRTDQGPDAVLAMRSGNAAGYR